MKMFDVTSNPTQLVLQKRPGPVIIGAVFMCVVTVVCYFSVIRGMLQSPGVTEQVPANRQLIELVCWAGIAVAGVLTVLRLRDAWQAVRGDALMFDLNTRQLTRNGRVKCSFDELLSIQLEEDTDQESTTHKLLLQPLQGRPILIESGNSNTDLQELTEIASLIATYTHLKVNHRKK